MNNVHPRVLERLKTQLPEGAEVVALTPVVGRTTVTYTVDGKEVKADMPKASLDRFLGNSPFELAVADGTPLNDALQTLSERYNLFMVQGVDYAESDSVIVFDGLGIVNYNLEVLTSSAFWTGAAPVKFIQETKVEYGGSAPMLWCLSDQQIQLALSSKVFEGEGEVLTGNKDSLTLTFAKKVIGYLKDLGMTSLKANDLGQAEIVDVVVDGFSGIVVVKPKKGPPLFIRYRSKGEDLNIPTPGDEDSE